MVLNNFGLIQEYVMGVAWPAIFRVWKETSRNSELLVKRITKRQKGNCSHLEDENTEGDVSVNPDGGLLRWVEAGQADSGEEEHGQGHGRADGEDDALGARVQVVPAVGYGLFNNRKDPTLKKVNCKNK